jgi:SAM-dependent methyltransferase
VARPVAGHMLRAIEFLLGRHYFYRSLRKLTGSDRVNREFVDRYVRPRSGDRLLDVGCGPADVCALMPQVSYIGVDASPNYIAAGRRRYGERATLICGDVNDLAQQHFGAFDTILCMGVIHHLSDAEVLGLLNSASSLLKPGGRFVSYDPCFTEPQHWGARWIHRHDRGNFVRFDRHYEDLISRVFRTYRREIRTDLCTVPATVIFFDCDSPAAQGFQPV